MKFKCRMGFHNWWHWKVEKPRDDHNFEIQRRECYDCKRAQSRIVMMTVSSI